MTVIKDIGFGVTISPFTTGDNHIFGGVIIEHDAPSECPYKGIKFGATTDFRCAGGVSVVPIPDKPDRPIWTVLSEDPLTLTPSILCDCNAFHGFITNGLWVPC